MPQYDYKCVECGWIISIETPMSEVKEKYRRNCETCRKQRTFTRLWTAGIAAFHDRYSPMNPRAGRGRGGAGLPKK